MQAVTLHVHGERARAADVTNGDGMSEDDVRRRIEAHPVEGSVADMRRAFARLAELPFDERGLQLERRVLHGLDTWSVTPRGDGARPDAPPVVHLHGGGYVFGSPSTHLRLAGRLAAASGATVHLPAYPLAPESPWPAQRDVSLRWLERLDGARGFVLSGDSAGGHLALSLALALPADRRDALRALVLFSPNTLRDYERSESRERLASRDAMNDPVQDDALVRLAFGETRADDPEQNPLDRDLAALPPTRVDVGADEVLLDDALLFARRAALAGVALDLHVAPGRFHLRQLFAGHWTVADESIEAAGRWLRDRERGGHDGLSVG